MFISLLTNCPYCNILPNFWFVCLSLGKKEAVVFTYTVHVYNLNVLFFLLVINIMIVAVIVIYFQRLWWEKS